MFSSEIHLRKSGHAARYRETDRFTYSIFVLAVAIGDNHLHKQNVSSRVRSIILPFQQVKK